MPPEEGRPYRFLVELSEFARNALGPDGEETELRVISAGEAQLFRWADRFVSAKTLDEVFAS